MQTVLKYGNDKIIFNIKKEMKCKFYSILIFLFCIISSITCLLAGNAFASNEKIKQEVYSADEGKSGGTIDRKGRILVAYETRKGSTREIAEAITREFCLAGWDSVAMDIETSPSPEKFDHVIVGGPIYFGKIKGIKAYIQRHEEILRERLKGAFAVGMFFAVQDEEKQASGRKALDEALAPLKPALLGYFAGSIDPQKLSLLEKGMIKAVKSPIGDHRNWDAISDWSREVLKILSR